MTFSAVCVSPSMKSSAAFLSAAVQQVNMKATKIHFMMLFLFLGVYSSACADYLYNPHSDSRQDTRESTQLLDYSNPLWKVDTLSAHQRVKEIESILRNIGDILRENFEDDDIDVESIKFHIEKIRFALYGFGATYGVRLP
jgi:hypothetical protein